MPLLIRNGEVVNADARFHGDVLLEGGTVSRIAKTIEPSEAPSAEVVDAAGCLVMPGFVDPHVHVHLPFMGTAAKDTHATASRAAVAGGTTAYLEMVCPAHDDSPGEALADWSARAAGASVCDYGFHLGVSRWDAEVERQLREAVAGGIRSFKVFLAYKGAFDLDDAGLLGVCSLAAELGVVVCAHCENAELVAAGQNRLVAAGEPGPASHERSRPVGVEAAGVSHFCTFLEQSGATGYVVHTSCRDAVEAALPFRRRGVDVTLETVIPYLVLDDTAAQAAGFEGAKYVMSPPIRSLDHQRFLWHALRTGEISTVATDHAPFDFAGQKEMGRPPEGDFTTIPNGIPSIEHRPALLWHHGVRSGRLDACRFVGLLSAAAAACFGLAGKGSLHAGADADVVVWDPEQTRTVSAATHEMNVDYSAFEGQELVGGPRLTIAAGVAVAERGRCTADGPAAGRLLT
ncbi:dihydropyrimidinase [Phycisphaera mikurensis]|uniref:D-hydantoinase n=1 Tax=Phycisphaera mikurensis (strain NBRC 102666 / KCTC 22515 / FYK2301M01) TaxID=1142394 RepID=I0IDC5_PHYMF|nr:dihydropyrimidinase [Phycisphaera mikurensis]MBB6443350.1 dihydropyrimidinase [Phycisphaera mikurensis]BAM03263.1 D-hydantoinase [Phycisphaera mikurensis NBRC 102666]